MTNNNTATNVISTAGAHEIGDDQLGRPSTWARLTARMRARQLDNMLAVGVPAPQGSALAVHAARLTSRAERELVAAALRRTLSDARHTTSVRSPRIPVDRARVIAAEDAIDKVTLRLHSPRPVSACGVARLRQLLTDGSGPLYRLGRGDLDGRLGAALAVL